QKVLTISERQAEQKRKMKFNAGNNQGYQQQNKRQNTRRAYTDGPGEKRELHGIIVFMYQVQLSSQRAMCSQDNSERRHLLRMWCSRAFQERLPEVEEWKPW
nr:hypothetical protein [Tanacetum cinerariifolium]